MIYKVLTRSTPSYNGLINYILNENKVQEKNVFTHNLRSHPTDIKGLTNEFMINESFRTFHRSDQIYLNHEIISFSALDSPKITPEVLTDIMEKYVSLRGSEGVYLGAIHQDKEHIHLHVAVSGLAYRTGKSFYLPKDKLNELKKELQEYQKEKYPELKHSLPKHGGRKEYLSDREWQANKKEGRNSIKEKIEPLIKEAFGKAGSQKEFLELLTKQNLHHYERNGIATGIIVDETKIRFTRLGISKEEINKLPMDINAEKLVLHQIQQIRLERGVKEPKLEKPESKIEKETIKESEHHQNLQIRLEEIQGKVLAIETLFEDKLLGTEASLSLQLQLENLQIEEIAIQKELNGNILDIEITPIEDGIVGQTKVIHTIENGIEKTYTLTENHLEVTYLGPNGQTLSNESYLEPDDKNDFNRQYDFIEAYEMGLINEDAAPEVNLDVFDLNSPSENSSESANLGTNEQSNSIDIDAPNSLNDINDVRAEMDSLDIDDDMER